MIKVQKKADLKDAPTNELVYVITSGKLYRSIDGEWVEKVYFTTKEIAQIIGISQHKVRIIIRALNLRPKSFGTAMRSSKLDQVQLRLIAQAAKRLNNKQTYSEIRKEMRL